LTELLELSSERSRFDLIVVESSGISEPLPVAEVFTLEQEGTGKRLSDYARLDTTVTVVDAFNFIRDYESPDTLASRKVAAFSGDERGVVDLLVDQVEFSDVIIVNKTDLVTAGELEGLLALLRRLNPAATLLPTQRAAVPLSSVALTGAFSMERAATAPGWLKELRGSHTPETAEYGITSFVFRAARPFHPARLFSLIRAGKFGALGCVIRSKGFAWLAVDGGMDEVALWSQAGRVWQLAQGRAWWATVPRSQWPASLKIKEHSERYGDRSSEIVFIGKGMVESVVRAALESALVNDEEWEAGPALWDSLDDPFDFFPYEDELDYEGEEEEEEEEEVGVEGGGKHVHGEECNHPSERPTTCRIIVEQ